MNRHRPGGIKRTLAADAVVLAGGQGRRLGRRKESVSLGSRTFLDHHLDRWGAMFDRVWVSAREPLEHPLPPGVETILDPEGAVSVIDSIAEILRRVARPVWIVAVDLPAIPPSIPETLFAAHTSGHSVFVEHERGLEMLCGLYDPTALPVIEALLSEGRRKLSEIATSTPARILRHPDEFPPAVGLAAELGPFFNVNTPEDLARLEALLSDADRDPR